MTFNLDPKNWKETCLFIMQNVRDISEAKRDICKRECTADIGWYPDTITISPLELADSFFHEIKSINYHDGTGEFYRVGNEFLTSEAIKAFKKYYPDSFLNT